MLSNAEEKKLKIIEAAAKRFARFGMAKTTMSDLANDLGISKASIYYYFPDKNMLYASVIEHVVERGVQNFDKMIDDTKDVESLMMKMLDARTETIKKYYNLFEYVGSFRKEVPKELSDLMRRLSNQELWIFNKIFQIGIDNGELKLFDINQTSQLLIYSLLGMRFGIIKDMNIIFFPSHEDFDFILKLQKKMVKIFIDGLRRVA